MIIIKKNGKKNELNLQQLFLILWIQMSKMTNPRESENSFSNSDELNER